MPFSPVFRGFLVSVEGGCGLVLLWVVVSGLLRGLRSCGGCGGQDSVDAWLQFYTV